MKYKVTLDGTTYEVDVEKGKAILVDQYEAVAPAPVAAPAATPTAAPAAAAAAPTSGTPVVAPMPGTILAVRVTPGQAVKQGDVLVVLEAMKMENDITATQDGTVGQVLVAKGASVDTDAVLLTLV